MAIAASLSRVFSRFFLAFLILAIGLASAGDSFAKSHKKKKSRHKVTIGAQAGVGYDSNAFNKPYGNESQAGNETASAKAKYSFKVSKRVKWRLGAGASNTYRLAGGNAKALKLGIKGQTGVDWKVFGAKSTKKNFHPNGKLSFNLGYSGTFNPTLVPVRAPRAAGFVDADGDGIDDADPDGVDDEDPDAIDEDDEVDDATLEDDLTGGEDDTFADESDDGDDEDDDEEGDDEEEDFFEEDPVGNQFFNSKPPRHAFTGSVSFAYQAFKKTKFTASSMGSINDVGETPGRVTSDAKGAGGGLKFEHVFNKMVSVNSAYNLGLKFFDAKTTTGGAKLKIVAHGFGVGAKFKPTKRLKIIPAYRLGYTSVPPNSASNAMFHQGRLGFDYKILKKGLSVFWENNVMYSGRTSTSTKDAKRYQTLVGLRGTLGWPK